MDVALYHEWDSVCSFKVRLCLAEKGLAWESHRVDLFNFENLRPGYLALNPNGVVPTLVVDGRPIVESSVINEYLDERFSDPPLMPRAPEARAEVRNWVKLQDDVLYHAQRPASFQLIVKPMLRRYSKEQIEELVGRHPVPERARHFVEWATGPLDRAVVADARQRCAQVIARIAKPLAERLWLAGASYSLADIAMAPFVERLTRLRFDTLWTDFPAVADWAGRLLARPAVAAAMAPLEFLMPGPAAIR